MWKIIDFWRIIIRIASRFMENKKHTPEQVMKLKESSHLLAEVLYADGVDIYKLSPDAMKELAPTIANTRARIDSVLREHYQISFAELDDLPSKELQKIRESFLGYYHGSVEKAEKLKKWVPLNQLVGYTEVLVASAYLQLNTEIDADIEKLITKNSTGATITTEHLRMRILNAYKKVNQGKKWEEVRQEVESYLSDAGIQNTSELFGKWRSAFESINHPLQELYTEHVETMQINDAIYDLQFAEQKRSAIIQNLIGSTRRSWKPSDLEHDIQAQSTEANRSVIELTCNAIDANEDSEKRVDIAVHQNGYSVRDHGSGMNPYVILEKLMIPKVSGKTGKETIGRFGVGFYTVLSHLKRKNDFVRVETHDGQTGHVIEFKIHERTGDIFVHTEKNDGLQKGTNVVVQAEDFDSRDAEKLCRGLLAYNDRADIVLNGEKMNTTEEFESVRGEQTSIKYSTEVADKSKVSIMVNGVVIEHINVSGVNLPQEVAIDFPLTCSLPESRSELSVDRVAISSVKEIIETVLTSQIDEPKKITTCNALYPVLEKLQARSRSNKRDDNLIVYLQDKFKDTLETEGKVFLPNVKAFQVLDIPNAVYLDSRVCSTDLEKIPGITKCEQFESTEGYQLFIADFKEGTTEFVVEDGKRLVIDRKVYERHKDTPAALNVYFSNLDGTGQSKKEKVKGRITQESQLRLEKKPVDSRKYADILSDEFLSQYISKPEDREKFREYYNLSDEQKRETSARIYIDTWTQFVEGYLSEDNGGEDDFGSKSFRRSHFGKPVTKEAVEGFLEELNRIVQNEPRDKWDEMILKANPIEGESTSVSDDNYFLYKKLRALDQTGLKSVLMDHEFAYRVIVSGEITEGIMDIGSQNEEDFLLELNSHLNLSESADKFKKFEKRVFKLFVSWISRLWAGFSVARDQLNLKFDLKEILERAEHIYLTKIANLSIEQQLGLINGMNTLFSLDNTLALVFQKKYQHIPLSQRGYLMYIVEGGEILNEKGFDEANIELSEYQAQIPLSILVQAKKDSEQYFQGFSGTPAELVVHARESQKGVDPSKAMRDIMHSTENQIVNDGYLWIREVLQNSLDAVKQNKDQFAEAPKVSVDTYLRKESKEVPEDQLWNVLQSAITRYYPEHFNYFRNAIARTVPTLRTENFASAIDALGALTDGSEKYFPDSLIQELKTQFEQMTFSEPELVVEARDPVGMDLHTVINYLLIPNESSKKYDEEAVGKFGQGFFTIFGDAKEVLIKTSKGNMRTEYIKIKPIKDQNGKILDFSVEMLWKVEEFKGTVIQKVVDTDMPQVEAAFCKSAVVSYGGLIDRKAVQLDFREQEVNTPRTVLAETTIPKLGTMRMYDAHENAMTQNGLFIKELEKELLELIPENLRKVMQKNGIVLDIPASIKLIKSRADIARKKEILPLLAEHIPALALRAYLSSVMLGKAELPNIPYDYFEAQRHRQVTRTIQNDAVKIVQGNPLTNYDEYLQDENALTQLLTMLPCINLEGKQISIFELTEKISEHPNSVDIDKLPQSIQEKIKYATIQKSQEVQDQEKAKREYESSDTMILSDRSLPDNPQLQETASVYYAYDQLVRFILQHSDASDVKPTYYLQVGQSKAHAYQGTNSIGFNLDYLEKQLPQLTEIIDKKIPAADIKVQRFLEEVIELCTHERQHNLEGSEETQWTHNDTFFEGQRKVIAKLIKDQSANIQNMLDEIYQKFTSSYVPAKQFIEQMQ